MNGYMTASRARAHFTRAKLNELFEYDPASGVLTRRCNGESVWRKNNHGYSWLWCNGAALLVHRIAWRMQTGEWPAMVDHINGDRSDNRWSNLRETNHLLNAQNITGAMKTNRTGFLGVCIDGRRKAKKYLAAIRVRGTYEYLGAFETPEEAHKAYLKAKARL